MRERFGYTAAVDDLLAANADRDVPVLPAPSRRLAEAVLILATYDDIADATSRWRDVGADRVDVVLPLGADDDAPEATVHAVAGPERPAGPATVLGARS